MFDHHIGQLGPTTREPAMPAVMLQQQREPERRRAAFPSQKLAIFVQQSPELDELVDVDPGLPHRRTSFRKRACPSMAVWGW